MKFGNRLLEQLHGPWAGNYLQYNDLKQILKGVSPVPTAHGDAAEGQFLSHLLSNIRAVDVFFAAKEVEHAVRLKALAQLLANPSSWLQTPLPVVDTDDVDLPQLVANIKEGVHVPTTQKVALDSFIALCAEIDVLRKYSVLNSLAITKIVKKHDKFSLVKLSTAILGFVKTQAFTTSRSLATTFTHAQLVASEVITAATATKPDTDDYTCVFPPRPLPPVACPPVPLPSRHVSMTSSSHPSRPGLALTPLVDRPAPVAAARSA